ncbi:hypothetical protein ES703_78445 [subsurface metagenome]
MDARRRQKLERYLKNASRFLWGLGPGNQKENYRWLREKGFEFDNGSYSHVIGQLLENYGVEEILRRLIIPRVGTLFNEKAIDFLRDSWRAGSIPDMSFLKLYNINNASPFLEVNSQFNYVERWEDLAGVWFEEIEEIAHEDANN